MTTLLDPQLIEDNLVVLRQGRALLDALDEGGFTRNAPALSLSGVGPHLRHVLDFYARFLAAFEGAEGAGAVEIDYDRRERDERVETQPAHACAALDATMGRLAGFAGRVPAGAPVQVRSDGSPWIPSTVDRELQSLVSHTVHHYALIAVAVRAHGGDPGREFGVAPSTLRHWREQRGLDTRSGAAAALDDSSGAASR